MFVMFVDIFWAWTSLIKKRKPIRALLCFFYEPFFLIVNFSNVVDLLFDCLRVKIEVTDSRGPMTSKKFDTEGKDATRHFGGPQSLIRVFYSPANSKSRWNYIFIYTHIHEREITHFNSILRSANNQNTF